MAAEQLSLEEIRMLAEVERRMDSGDTPHIIVEGQRWAALRVVLDHLGIVSGQTVNRALLHELLKAQIMHLQKLREQESPPNP